MSKYDYVKRLKQMVRREKELIRRECALAKANWRFNDSLEKLEQRYYAQCKELQQWHHQLQALRENVQQQEQAQTEANHRLKHLHEKMQRAQQRIMDATEEHKHLLEQLYKIRCLKESTSTFINLPLLTEGTVQGVTLLETANNSEWQPFRLHPLQHTPEQLKQLIWGESEEAAMYSEAWEELVFRAVRATLQRQAAKQEVA